MAGRRSAVVVAAGRDAHLVVDDLVDEAVLVGDAPRPVAGEVVAECLGLTDALVAVPADVGEELVDPLEGPTILRLPPPLVLPGVLVPDEQHSVGLDRLARHAAAGLEPLHRVEQTTGVAGGAHEVGRFAQCFVVLEGHGKVVDRTQHA